MTAEGDGEERESARPPAGRRTDRLGDLLPPSTTDESARGWGDADADADADDADSDDRLRREVPPHHDR
jgi:hypothetical protein